MQVGFIGLGRMGSPIAANLLGAGHDLTVYNRTKAKAEHLVKRGAQLAKTPGEAARGDVVTAIVNGKNPPQLTAKKLMRLALEIPIDWTEQRKLLGFHHR